MVTKLKVVLLIIDMKKIKIPNCLKGRDLRLLWKKLMKNLIPWGFWLCNSQISHYRGGDESYNYRIYSPDAKQRAFKRNSVRTHFNHDWTDYFDKIQWNGEIFYAFYEEINNYNKNLDLDSVTYYDSKGIEVTDKLILNELTPNKPNKNTSCWIFREVLGGWRWLSDYF